MNDINFLEKLAANTHPALEKIEYDSWLIQFAEGYTRRANSVLPLETGNIPLETKITECEKMYQQKNLPCIFKMTKAAPEGLQTALEAAGFKAEAPTELLTVNGDSPVLQERLESLIEPENLGVIITSKPDQEWLDCFFEFEGRTEPKTMKIATRQFEILEKNKDATVIYCRIQMTGKNVAVASAVIQDGIFFLLNVVVKTECRGQGYGNLLLKEIIEAACMQGAERLCLQVVQDNTVAVNMYKTFGFEYYYTYWYMVK